MLPDILDVGTVVDDRYEIIELLGGGGMGAVYRVRERTLDRIVALKIMHSVEAGPEDLARFEREGSAMSEMSHRNIAMVYRISLAGAKPYLVMEYLNGKTLRDLIADNPKGMEPARVIRIAAQIADALAHAHGRGVVHRDLKPENVIILAEPEPDFVKVVDFGLARMTGEGGAGDQKLTQTGALVGSVMYMSPEQCLGKKASPLSDIYSLGCIIYECLTGRQPFEADNPIGMLHLHVTETPRPISSLISKPLPAGLESAVAQAMSKSPEGRFKSAAELKDELQVVERALSMGICGPARKSILNQSAFRALIVVVVALSLVVIAFSSSQQAMLLVSRKYCEFFSGSEMVTQKVRLSRWLFRTGRTAAAYDLVSDVAQLYRVGSVGHSIKRSDTERIWADAKFFALADACFARSEMDSALGRYPDAVEWGFQGCRYLDRVTHGVQPDAMVRDEALRALLSLQSSLKHLKPSSVRISEQNINAAYWSTARFNWRDKSELRDFLETLYMAAGRNPTSLFRDQIYLDVAEIDMSRGLLKKAGHEAFLVANAIWAHPSARARARYLMGLICEDIGDLGRAKALYLEAWNLHKEYRLSISWRQTGCGFFQDAEKSIEAGVSATANSHKCRREKVEETGEYFNRLVRIYIVSGKTDEVRRISDRAGAILMAPENQRRSIDYGIYMLVQCRFYGLLYADGPQAALEFIEPYLHRPLMDEWHFAPLCLFKIQALLQMENAAAAKLVAKEAQSRVPPEVFRFSVGELLIALQEGDFKTAEAIVRSEPTQKIVLPPSAALGRADTKPIMEMLLADKMGDLKKSQTLAAKVVRNRAGGDDWWVQGCMILKRGGIKIDNSDCKPVAVGPGDPVFSDSKGD